MLTPLTIKCALWNLSIPPLSRVLVLFSFCGGLSHSRFLVAHSVPIAQQISTDTPVFSSRVPASAEEPEEEDDEDDDDDAGAEKPNSTVQELRISMIKTFSAWIRAADLRLLPHLQELRNLALLTLHDAEILALRFSASLSRYFIHTLFIFFFPPVTWRSVLLIPKATCKDLQLNS